MKKIITCESVTEGHPDKVCDFISDSILDAYLKMDPKSRVAIECVAGKNNLFITGEVTSKGEVDLSKVAREALKEIGYNKENGLDIDNYNIIVDVSKQSSDISMGVDNFGAGDQGMMYGYATNETDELMPLSLVLAHKLTKRLTECRKKKILDFLRPDGKSQVSIEYLDNKIRVDSVVVSSQHDDIDINIVREGIKKEVIDYVIPKNLVDANTKFFINPTGRFVIGGPIGDSGLTGRKIIVDTYGGVAHHGGGAFSGKDPTKVDRSANYMCRFIAKNIVSNNLADKCEVMLSYAIGVKEPTSINIDTFNTSELSNDELIEIIKKNFDLTPQGIIKTLDLLKPIYRKTTNYGHFGKENLPWEKIIKLEM
ncbi:MAG: methionine adenosyltransferase [Bacilli bacterium]|nr:methionine adenosyltransferase [Bacilli bacterium]